MYNFYCILSSLLFPAVAFHAPPGTNLRGSRKVLLIKS